MTLYTTERREQNIAKHFLCPDMNIMQLLCFLQVVTGSKAWSSIHLQILIQLLKVLPADLT